MSAHPLKIHHHPAKRPSQRPPLLFVHGGYTNARCWEHNFIPYFQQKGYDCHALDLSGHGEAAATTGCTTSASRTTPATSPTRWPSCRPGRC
jgi:pimeloyl-ACP methyl ester carboxylesterase